VPGFDAIIIPGGGVLADGSLPEWIQPRFQRAVEMQADGPFLALSGGTHHKPSPLDAAGRPIFEAYAGARFLLERGVPAERIFTEISSYDTIGNAFFARAQHCDVRQWRRLLIVNGEFHMPRTEAIFRWVFGLAPVVDYQLQFETTPDSGMPEEERALRGERERASLAALPAVTSRVSTLAGLHRFLYREHAAYAVDRATAVRPVIAELARIY
jgi:uncharacterized SAM-binding protein YcdF (DUF218 family)